MLTQWNWMVNIIQYKAYNINAHASGTAIIHAQWTPPKYSRHLKKERRFPHIHNKTTPRQRKREKKPSRTIDTVKFNREKKTHAKFVWRGKNIINVILVLEPMSTRRVSFYENGWNDDNICCRDGIAYAHRSTLVNWNINLTMWASVPPAIAT